MNPLPPDTETPRRSNSGAPHTQRIDMTCNPTTSLRLRAELLLAVGHVIAPRDHGRPGDLRVLAAAAAAVAAHPDYRVPHVDTGGQASLRLGRTLVAAVAADEMEDREDALCALLHGDGYRPCAGQHQHLYLYEVPAAAADAPGGLCPACLGQPAPAGWEEVTGQIAVAGHAAAAGRELLPEHEEARA